MKKENQEDSRECCPAPPTSGAPHLGYSACVPVPPQLTEPMKQEQVGTSASMRLGSAQRHRPSTDPAPSN